jgi:hypothetical protein
MNDFNQQKPFPSKLLEEQNNEETKGQLGNK